jgi:TM2 domain-containing membrane protein YozV
VNQSQQNATAMSNDHVYRLRSRRRLQDFTRERQPKDRGLYLVLALLLGFTGAHNFYAERLGPALGQLALGLLNAGLLFSGLAFGWATAGALLLWVLWDMLTVRP